MNEESDASLGQTESVAGKDDTIEKEKTEMTDQSSNNGTRKRRSLQVKLVFQTKTYSRTGAASALIREQLLQDMIADRAADLAGIPLDMYYTKSEYRL